MSNVDGLAAILRRLDQLHDRLDDIAPRVTPDHYTKSQVAELLNVSVDTVTRWCDRGDLPTFRQGQVVRIPRPGFEKFRRRRTRA